MKSASAVNFYHGNDGYYTIMVHRPDDNGLEYGEKSQCEFCHLTKEEAWLVAKWAERVLDNKTHCFTNISPSGWVIFLPKCEVNVRPLMSPLQHLIEAIGRHPVAEADADVADAINAIDDALCQRSE